jgi:hypothetical protein
MLRSFAIKTLYAVSATVVATVLSAHVNAQTIVVDGVTYQAVSSAPVVSAMPAPPTYPALTYPVQAPVVTSAPEPVQQPVAYNNNANLNIAIPLFVALGLWAASDWISPFGGHRHRAANAPAPVPPTHGNGYHHPR